MSKTVKIADWKRLLLFRKTEQGAVIKALTANASTIFAHDPAWEGVLAYDEFAETICTRRPPPCRPHDSGPNPKAGDWIDEDTIRTQCWLSDAYALDLGQKEVLAAVKIAAARAPFHPVRNWLQGLRWDGVRRVRTWLVDVMGCDDTAYTREVGSAILIAAVARIYDPGCKVDTAPILEGEQGAGKSSVIRALVSDAWFLEMSITDVSNKDAMQVLRRKWIAELPEFDGLSKTEASHVKSYFSRQTDTYRPSYGTGPRDFKRQIVFLASTNKHEYLVDETGGRRFHPIRCRKGNVPMMLGMRDQLWAEAVALYESGVPWHVVDPELNAQFAAEQDARHRAHPWEEKIAQWLDRPVDIPMGKKRSDIGVTTGDVLEHAIKLDVSKWTQREANDAAACLRRLGWHQGKQIRRNGTRVRLYFPAGQDPSAPLEESDTGIREIGPLADAGDTPSDEELAVLNGE